MSIRLIDAETVPYLHSQTIYHAVAHAKTPESLNTIILVTPAQPYICIGYHQELEREIDTEYCLTNDLPIVRREVGGGAVYLDQNQLFVQWVFRPDQLPWRLDRRFEFFAKPLVKTYQAIGIDAYFRPANDIQVDGKKIGGLGAGAIGNAEVMVGNFLLDFDFERMSKALKIPNENVRNEFHRGMQQYVTTVTKELGRIPDRDEIKQIYMRMCEEMLGESLANGSLTEAEIQIMEQLNAQFVSDSWLNEKGGLKRPGVKIQSDVWLYEINHKTDGAMIHAMLRVHNNHIDHISLSGDFASDLQSKLGQFEKCLLQKELSYSTLLGTVESFFKNEKINTHGIRNEDWVQALLMHKQV